MGSQATAPRTRLRDHLPRPTVRRRLTLLYSSIFLVSGAILLVITGLLWNSSTTRRVVISSDILPRILQRLAPVQASGVISPTVFPQKLPVKEPAFHWISLPAPGGHQVTLVAPAGIRGFTTADLGQQRFVAGQLRLVATTQHSNDLHQLLLFSGLALAIMLLLAILAGWLLAGRVLRPLQTITSAARDISATNLHERLRLDGPADELKRLGDTFDDLLERLEGSFQSQRQFVANAAHELRTPLATMRASVDVATNKPDGASEGTTMLADRIRSELDQVERLLESFLSLARAQRDQLPDAVPVALRALIDDALETNSDAINARSIDLDRETPGDVEVLGSRVLLGRMVENLVANAVRHNVDAGWIRVALSRADASVRLVVENGGEMLDDETISELVQPFKRVGAARTGSDEGAGLGLSIVDAIASAHGGTLTLHALPGGGLRTVVELPLRGPERDEPLQ